MPFPRSVDLHVQFQQPVVASADVSSHGPFGGNEAFVAPGCLVEQNGERRVTSSRFLPYAEVVHEFFDGWRCTRDLLLRVVGAGQGRE